MSPIFPKRYRSGCIFISQPGYRQLIGKFEELRLSPVFQLVLRIQKLAKLYEEKTCLKNRNILLSKKIDEINNSNRIETAQLEILRADRRKRQHNISDLNLKIIEETNNKSAEIASAQKNRKNIDELKEQSITVSITVILYYIF